MVIGHEAWHGFSHCGSLVHERDPLWADLHNGHQLPIDVSIIANHLHSYM
jgi:hypothetical protein